MLFFKQKSMNFISEKKLFSSSIHQSYHHIECIYVRKRKFFKQTTKNKKTKKKQNKQK